MDTYSGEGSSHQSLSPSINTKEDTILTFLEEDVIFTYLSSSGRKIPKVPLLLRQEDRNHGTYDPKVVSFGPYHHGKAELQLCEQAKHDAVRIYVKGSNKSREFFFKKVLQVIEDARNCYVDGSTDKHTDEEFAEMLLLDACFLIYFMDIGEYDPIDQFLISNHLGGLVVSLVYSDMFLLENQIPLLIVMRLINLRYNNHKGEEALSKFLHQTIWGHYKQQQILNNQQNKQQHEQLHLLEAFHSILVWDGSPQTHATVEQKVEVDLKKRYKAFRSAKDLRAKGIHFRPSSNKSLRDINFFSFTFYGQLRLPTWFISNHSKVFFLNMIAYELCPNNIVDTTVINYINFMKSLVQSAADIKELREKRILLTSLGTDEEVVSLYADLHTYGMANTECFREVQRRIQMHYDSRAKTWMAELIHIYLSSPWSIIAWFAGLLLLIMTFLQTYFTIKR